jgi:hypothetical protein
MYTSRERPRRSDTPALAASTCAAQQLAVSPLQTNVFYIDTDVNYLGSYVGYRVSNTGAGARSDLWVRLESFTGNVQPATGGAATRAIPVDPLAAGAGRPTYAYLKAAGPTAVAQTHDVVLYAGRPDAGGVEVCRETQTLASASSSSCP